MKRFFQLLYRFEATLAALAYIIVVLAMLADVVAREFFDLSLMHSSKIALFAAIFAGMLGLGLATSTGNHIRPKITDQLLPAVWQNLLQRLGDVLSGALFLLAGYVSFGLVQSSYEIGFLVPVVDWPLWWFQSIMPYAFCSNALRYFGFALSPSLKPEEADAA
ncbi:Tripartite ATP-independent periplasmic transporter, DctQ component [Pseudovibrio sp. W64]|uniref:TRAP transporter small permease n=1 Tax=unclassified Pseudovibrio TaxID=2627060 RepID=UPI00070DA5BA|nr:MULTISPECIES: TRAP transporter small permease subunit [unclassified Pseudovibrio]KZK78594.1 Tripartite ATP-independent periplasmic transporter, DctQ component [Pseudovibrio sp. W64]